MTTIKHAGVIAWLLGIAIVIGLVIWSGIGSIAQAIASVGWGNSAGPRSAHWHRQRGGGGLGAALPRTQSSWAWHLHACALHPRGGQCTAAADAGSAATSSGRGSSCFMALRGPLAAASIIVDILIQAVTQFLFCLPGRRGAGGARGERWFGTHHRRRALRLPRSCLPASTSRSAKPDSASCNGS